MKRFYADISTSNAALTVGAAFITSVFIVSLVDNFLLANFVVSGDVAALARDIAANKHLFISAVIGYLIVLTLDSIIALVLYIVLSPSGAACRNSQAAICFDTFVRIDMPGFTGCRCLRVFGN